MKIAAITLTRNDDFRLVPWKMYFQDSLLSKEIFSDMI